MALFGVMCSVLSFSTMLQIWHKRVLMYCCIPVFTLKSMGIIPKCMKMTVDIPNDLHKKLKLRAVKDETTIKDLIIDLLEGEFGKSRDQKNVERLIGKRKNAL